MNGQPNWRNIEYADIGAGSRRNGRSAGNDATTSDDPVFGRLPLVMTDCVYLAIGHLRIARIRALIGKRRAHRWMIMGLGCRHSVATASAGQEKSQNQKDANEASETKFLVGKEIFHRTNLAFSIIDDNSSALTNAPCDTPTKSL